MSKIVVIPEPYVESCLKYTLINAKNNWPSHAEVVDESKLYNPPEPSSPNTVPAHLGFDPNSDVLLRVCYTAANKLLGSSFMTDRTIPFWEGEPERISTFRGLYKTLHRRMSTMIKLQVATAVVKRTIESWVGAGNRVLMKDPPPQWGGSKNILTFIADLIVAIEDQLPDIDKSVFTPDVVKEIKKAKLNSDIRDIIIKVCIAPTLEERMKKVIC